MTAPTLPIIREPVLDIRVYGTPAPQGSKNTNKYGAVYESSAKVKPWREAVKAAALDQLLGVSRPSPPQPADGPIAVTLMFVLDRPKSHYRTGRNAALLRDSAPAVPITKPDLDKLVRSTLDAIKDAGVYRDDSQVAHIDTTKVYASSIHGIPGAIITVRSME